MKRCEEEAPAVENAEQYDCFDEVEAGAGNVEVQGGRIGGADHEGDQQEIGDHVEDPRDEAPQIALESQRLDVACYPIQDGEWKQTELASVPRKNVVSTFALEGGEEIPNEIKERFQGQKG